MLKPPGPPGHPQPPRTWGGFFHLASGVQSLNRFLGLQIKRNKL